MARQVGLMMIVVVFGSRTCSVGDDGCTKEMNVPHDDVIINDHIDSGYDSSANNI